MFLSYWAIPSQKESHNQCDYDTGCDITQKPQQLRSVFRFTEKRFCLLEGPGRPGHRRGSAGPGIQDPFEQRLKGLEGLLNGQHFSLLRGSLGHLPLPCGGLPQLDKVL